MMSARSAYKGRAYQCRICSKVDRKGRTIAHVLKHHVPFDRVPFSCSLCNFRCQEREKLVEHIKKYKRHQEELAKKGHVNHSLVLHKADNPIFVGDSYIIALSKEESTRYFARENRLFAEDDGIFDDDEEEDPLMLPDWAKDDVMPSVRATMHSPFVAVTATPLNHSPSQTIVSNQHTGLCRTSIGSQPAALPCLSVPSAILAPKSQSPFSATIDAPIQLRLAATQSSWTSTSAAPSLPIFNEVQQFPTISLQDLYPTTSANSSLAQYKTIMAPRKDTPLAPSVGTATPLCDERTTPTEDLLPQLLEAAEATDPLLLEISSTEKSSKLDIQPIHEPDTEIPLRQDNKRPSSDVPETEPKRVKTSAVDLDPIVQAINNATQQLTDALDRNSRAIRCQGATLERAVSELRRIERQLDRSRILRENQSQNKSRVDSSTQTNREKPSEKESKKDNKENRNILKSTVTKANSGRK